MTQYTMTVKDSGTRLRKNHTTFSTPPITSFASGQVLLGDAVWIASADGQEVKKYDQWLHVTHVDGVPLKEAGWTAFSHMGKLVCENWQMVTDTPIPTPPPAPIYVIPDSFVLVAPDGTRTEFKKAV